MVKCHQSWIKIPSWGYFLLDVKKKILYWRIKLLFKYKLITGKVCHILRFFFLRSLFVLQKDIGIERSEWVFFIHISLSKILITTLAVPVSSWLCGNRKISSVTLHSSPSKLVQIPDSWHTNSNQTQQNSCQAYSTSNHCPQLNLIGFFLSLVLGKLNKKK